MGNTFIIAGKEVRIYLTTWTSYVLCGAFMLITAFFFQSLVAGCVADMRHCFRA